MRDFAMILLACFLLLAGATEAPAQRPVWFRDIPSGRKDAQANVRPMLIYVRSGKVQNCTRFETQTLFTPLVESLLRNSFTCVVIDSDADRNTPKALGVFAVPTLILVDTSGREYSRFVTFHDPYSFTAAIRDAKAPPALDTSAVAKTNFGGTEIFRERFDSLYGWSNDGSVASAQLQLSLVKGVDGRAFKAQYQLAEGDWSYVQFYRELDQKDYFVLPPKYTMVFQVAGLGGYNSIDIKLVDEDGTNFGISVPIPTDFKGHQFAVTSDRIGYLWGGVDKALQRVKIIQIAITPDKAQFASQGGGTTPRGVVFLDEMVILDGFRRDIPSDYQAAGM